MAKAGIYESLVVLDGNFPVERKRGRDFGDVDRVKAHVDWITSELQERMGVPKSILDITVSNIDRTLGPRRAYLNWKNGWELDAPELLVLEAKKKNWNVGNTKREKIPDLIRTAYCISAMRVALDKEKQSGRVPDPDRVKELLAELMGEKLTESIEPKLTEASLEDQWAHPPVAGPEYREQPLEKQWEREDKQQESVGVEHVETPIYFGPVAGEESDWENEKDGGEIYPHNWMEIANRLAPVLNVGCTPEQSEAIVAAWVVSLAKNLNEAETRELIKQFEEEFPSYIARVKGAGRFVNDKVDELIGGRRVSFFDVAGWQTAEEQQADIDSADILRGTVLDLKSNMIAEQEPWASLANTATKPANKVKCKQPVTAVLTAWGWGSWGTIVRENMKVMPEKKRGNSLEIPKRSMVLVVGFDGENRFLIDPVSGTVLKSKLNLAFGSESSMVTVDIG